MKNIKRGGIVFLTLVMAVLCAKTNGRTLLNNPPKAFRIIGYVRTGDIESGRAAAIDLRRMNYINIAFINPDQNGNFLVIKGLADFIAAAHKNKVKVLASIGGGLAPDYYAALLGDSLRQGFIKKIVKMVTDNQLDGIDVDLEGDHIDSNYENFIAALSASLKPGDKLVTAAVATVYKTRYTDRALALLDFINIMSYDKTGPWNPAKPGQHSPYTMAVADIDYWGSTRGIAKEKLSLGVPFYGYGFGPDTPGDMSFKNIVIKYPGAENADSVMVAGGGTIYYNGLPTMKAKTTLALQNAGGIMFWQLFQDGDGKFSLLNTINTTVKEFKN